MVSGTMQRLTDGVAICYLYLKYRIIKMYELLTRSVNCLFAQIVDNGLRCIICDLRTMTHLAIIHCIVVMKSRRLVTFLAGALCFQIEFLYG